MARVFISYRRDEDVFVAYLIKSRLGEVSRCDVFWDIEALETGAKFIDDIRQAVHKCEVMVVVIGKHWLDISDDAGNRRLDNPEDILRQEVAIALKRDIHVIPVLINGATMPKEGDLPEDLKQLSERNAHRIDHYHVDYDLVELVKSIEKKLGLSDKSNSERIIPISDDVSILDRELPGHIFWLAHNIEHVRLRLEWLWSKNEVISMLENCIHHATLARVPLDYSTWLRQIRDKVDQLPQNQIHWHEYAQELEIISRKIAKVAESSHPKDRPFVLPTQASELIILEALYGADETWVNVTDTVRASVRNNLLRLKASNSKFGGDPIKGVPKTLKLVYSYGVATYSKEVAEDETLQLPESSAE